MPSDNKGAASKDRGSPLMRVRIRLAQKGQAFSDNSLLLVIDKVFQIMTESQFFLLCYKKCYCCNCHSIFTF
jgi:hypothetical protein